MPRRVGISDHLGYAFIGAIIGCLIGVIGWWLYGLAHSLNYRGPGMDPILRHWLIWSGLVFAAFGLVLRERTADLFVATISAIFHFEIDQAPRNSGLLVNVIFLGILVAAIWFTVPR